MAVLSGMETALEGKPDRFLSYLLIGTALLLIVAAFVAPRWLKLGLAVWVIAP